ncbi:MAG: zinc ribbon domain-containing protein [Elusimicrobiota bacterium]
MILSKETLKALVLLQSRDSDLDGLKAERERIPVEVGALRKKIESGKSRLALAKASIIGFEKQKKEREIELAQKEESEQKHSRELNAVKTNEAFKALQSEIAKAKADAGDIETQILQIMEQIDAARRLEKTAAAEFAGAEKSIMAEIAECDARAAQIDSRFESAKAARAAAAAAVDPAALKLYERIREHGRHDAVVAIEGSHCGACRISLAPHVIVDLTKASQAILCESCQRILYRPESLAATAAQ